MADAAMKRGTNHMLRLVHGQQHNRRGPAAFTDGARHGQTVEAGHFEIEHRDLRLQPPDGAQRGHAVPCLQEHPHPGVRGEHLPHRREEARMIIGENERNERGRTFGHPSILDPGARSAMVRLSRTALSRNTHSRLLWS